MEEERKAAPQRAGKRKKGRIRVKRVLHGESEAARWHGYLGCEDWAVPRMVAECKEEARPGYDTCTATEYADDKRTLSAKVAVLVEMLKRSKACVVYTGAGISTAAGIGDYASKAPRSLSRRPARGLNRKRAEPTVSHRVVTALSKRKMVQQWVNQNHDGLAQKAGFPLSKLNEIHGSWFDAKNPVLMMDDRLRPDLLERLNVWEDKADLTLAMGTSMCGMTSDCVATTVGERAATLPVGAELSQHASGKLGLVIVNLQRTKQDHLAALRIFAPIDVVMTRVAKLCKLKLSTRTLEQRDWVK